MPTIPNYQAVGVARPNANYRPATPSGTSGLGEGLQSLGQAALGVSNNLYAAQQKREAEAQAEAEKETARQKKLALGTAMGEYVGEVANLQDAIDQDPDFNGHVKKFEEGHKAIVGKITGKLLPDVAEEFNYSIMDNYARGLVATRHNARAGFQSQQQNSVEQFVNQSVDTALRVRDPRQRGFLFAGIGQAIDAVAEANPNDAQLQDWAAAQKKGASERFAFGTLDLMDLPHRIKALERGMTVKDGVRTFVKTGTDVDYIPPDKRSVLLDRAYEDAKRAAAIGKEEARQSYNDTMAYIERTGDATKIIPQAKLTAIWGVEGGKRMYDAQVRNAKFGRAMQSIALTPIADDVATYRAMLPTGTENARESFQHADAYARAMAAKIKAIQDDPAKYVIENSPAAAKAFSDAMSGARKPLVLADAAGDSAWNQYATIVKGTYDHMGVPPPSRGFLPETVAKEISAKMMSGDDINAATMMDHYRSQMTADEFDAFYSDVVSKGKLKAPLQVLNEATPAARQELVSAFKVPEKDMNTKIGTDDGNAIEGAVTDALSGFGASLFSGPQGSLGSDAYMERYRAAVALAKYRIYSGKETSPYTAAKNAADQIVNHNYDYGDGYRVPKGMGDAVASFAADVLSKMKPSDLRVKNGARNELLGGALADRVSRAEKIWITTKDNRGLQLYLRATGEAVYDADGNPISVQFSKVPSGSGRGYSDMETRRAAFAGTE